MAERTNACEACRAGC